MICCVTITFFAVSLSPFKFQFNSLCTEASLL